MKLAINSSNYICFLKKPKVSNFSKKERMGDILIKYNILKELNLVFALAKVLEAMKIV